MLKQHCLIGQIELKSGGFCGFIGMSDARPTLRPEVPMTWDVTKARAFPNRKVAQMYLDRIHGWYSVSTFNGEPTRFVFVDAVTAAATQDIEL